MAVKESNFQGPFLLGFVAGMTELETVVMVNAQAVPVAADGSFEAQITLPNEGIATITVEAKDKQGKTSTVQRTVFVRF